MLVEGESQQNESPVLSLVSEMFCSSLLPRGVTSLYTSRPFKVFVHIEYCRSGRFFLGGRGGVYQNLIMLPRN